MLLSERKNSAKSAFTFIIRTKCCIAESNDGYDKMNHQKIRVQKKGFTLVEVLIAIAISSIVSVLIFASYSTLMRNFSQLSSKAATVRSMALAKRTVDACFRNIDVVTGVYGNRIEFTPRHSDSLKTITFQNGDLLYGSKSVFSDVSRFSCSLVENKRRKGKVVLLWEIVIGNDNWIGGAVDVIQKRNP